MVIANLAIEEIAQAVDFRHGQSFGEAQRSSFSIPHGMRRNSKDDTGGRRPRSASGGYNITTETKKHSKCARLAHDSSTILRPPCQRMSNALWPDCIPVRESMRNLP